VWAWSSFPYLYGVIIHLCLTHHQPPLPRLQLVWKATSNPQSSYLVHKPSQFHHFNCWRSCSLKFLWHNP
jgi:hypothetical protein